MANITIPSSTPTGRSSGLLAGPLSVLYSGNTTATSLNYPLELGTDATKSHYVQIGVYGIVPAGYNNGASDNIPGATIGAPNITGVVGGAIAGGAQSAVSNLASLGNKFGVNIPADVQAAAQSGITNFGNALRNARGFQIEPTTTKLYNLISLYMPDSVDARYNAEFSDVDLASQYGKILQTIRSVDHVVGTANNPKYSTLESKAKAISTDPTVIKAAIDIAGGALGASAGLTDALLYGQGYAINPQLQLIYRGLPLRTFTLTFLFTPKSRQEADVVNLIIHTLKYHSLPALEQGATGSTDSMFLVPPSIFDVKFMNKGAENTYLPKYDKCVLESIDVDNTPNGFAAHVDGSPVQTRVSLQFKELHILHKAKLGVNPNSAEAR